MKKYAMPLLRIAIAIVFIWFGSLKILGVSPIAYLIKATYISFPEPLFITILGIGELLIGLGLLVRKTTKIALVFLLLQMCGIFLGVLLAPSIYFLHNNPLLLTTEGEFVVKNLVFVTAALVIYTHES